MNTVQVVKTNCSHLIMLDTLSGLSNRPHTDNPEDYTFSMIDSDGNYIIKGKSFKNSKFFEFYKSYNESDYHDMEAPQKKPPPVRRFLVLLSNDRRAVW